MRAQSPNHWTKGIPGFCTFKELYTGKKKKYGYTLENAVLRKGFPGGSNGKESACNAGDLGSIPGLGRFPGEEYGKLLQYPCLENPHGQRRLVGYSPWGHKESHN